MDIIKLLLVLLLVATTESSECPSVVYCGVPPSMNNGFIKKINNATSEIKAFYSCFAGFRMDGANFSVCQNDGKWTTPGSCKAEYCEKVPPIANGYYKLNSTYGSNDSIVHELRCILPNVEHGCYSSDHSIEYNEEVTLSCFEGYINIRMRTADATLQCTETGELNFLDICIDIDECLNTSLCNHICTNLNGSYACTCSPGFDLSVSNGATGFFLPNDDNDTKSGHKYIVKHTCVRVGCHPPPAPMNGFLMSQQNTFLFNERVQILCDFGFVLNGSAFAYCSGNGSWTYGESDKPPICSMLTCSLPEPTDLELAREPQGLMFLKPGESLKITCKMQCDNCSNNSKILHCARDMSGDGFRLQGDNPRCLEVNCGDIPWPEILGVVQKELNDTTYGHSIQFDCEPGFIINGYSSLGNTLVECQRNGIWGFNTLTCLDNEKPIITSCPELLPFNLYELLIYELPKVSDNSGHACVVLDSGPPSGVSIVSRNTTLRFRAFDSANNEAFISCEVVLKEGESYYMYQLILFKYRPKEPWIQCPSTIDYNMGVHVSEVKSVSELRLNILHSGDGRISFQPAMINFTLGSTFLVKANIMKDNGHSAVCAFLIRSITKICSKDTLKPPDHGEIKVCAGTNTNMTCQAHCSVGYIYQDMTSVKSYTCFFGQWSSELPLLPCLDIGISVYDYNISVTYLVNGQGSGFPHAKACLESHSVYLYSHILKQKPCNLKVDSLQFPISLLADNEVVRSNFSLFLEASGVGEIFLQHCKVYLANSSYFGPSFPNKSPVDCLEPWFESKTEVTTGTLSCRNGKQLIKNFCLPCGPGHFINNGSCTECPNGTYQDQDGQSNCTTCITQYSHYPRTSKSHCFELCPEGFTSSSGYTTEKCAQCQINTYSSDNRTVCEPCSLTTKNNYCAAVCRGGYFSSTGFEPCQPCPTHFYSVNGTQCLECPSEKFTLNKGSSNLNDCISDGYYGERCNESCGVCPTKPCYNDEMCIEKGQNATCECRKYECDINPQGCLNEGACNNDINGYTCSCKKGFTGEKCEIYPELCDGHSCAESAGGICVKNYHNLTYRCLCPKFYDLTSVPINSCRLSPCENGGTCTNEARGFSCTCTQDFEGSLCERKRQICPENMIENHCLLYEPCLHGGTCTNTSYGYECMCPLGWTGKNCHMLKDYCKERNQCLNDAVCYNLINGTFCQCMDGTHGHMCEKKIDLCEHYGHIICGGGTCQPVGATAKCDCDHSHTSHENNNRLKLVVGVSCAVAALLIIILIIVGVCSYRNRKNTRMSQQRTVSGTDVLDHCVLYNCHQSAIYIAGETDVPFNRANN
ncbi:hypothetical protein Btru_039489 [Bulinus truncatus]|nr:hypothetical protein Btru_039489 [Bulinus truncatus]